MSASGSQSKYGYVVEEYTDSGTTLRALDGGTYLAVFVTRSYKMAMLLG
jgi:hypothetical protein